MIRKIKNTNIGKSLIFYSVFQNAFDPKEIRILILKNYMFLLALMYGFKVLINAVSLKWFWGVKPGKWNSITSRLSRITGSE